MKVKSYLLSLTFGLLLFSIPAFSQGTDLMSSYEDYAELEREVVYLHLNKSTYIKGESIGIKAYVLDKASKLLSTETSNLYCTISDLNNSIIKKKLLMVNNGIAINDFTIDSLFTSGEYKITAYTNWMKNFDEKNYFSQNIRIIDPEVEKEAKQLKATSEIDAQFLPEGGHLVANVETIIGAVIKDNFGFGIPNLECEVKDSENNQVTSFKLNQFGLGQFSLTPQTGKAYKVSFKLDEKEYTFNITAAETRGIGLRVNQQKDNTFVTLKTNTTTLSSLQNQVYTIALHNGNVLKEFNFRFNDELEIVKAISNSDLFPGINIITVLDANNTPLLERMLFNYEGVNLITSGQPFVKKKGDSLLVSLPYKSLNVEEFNNFSISVMPSNTRAYNHHENISSSILLQPYVRGYIENSHYYFQSVTPKKQYELDVLLRTQGWSSYDWETIFNDPPDYDYDFENGISYVANFTNNNQQQLIIYPTLNSPLEIIELQPGEMAFEKQEFFPISDEKIEIGAIDNKGKPTTPNIALNFSPKRIPDFKLASSYTALRPRESGFSGMNNYNDFENGWRKIEKLDEVILTGKRKYTEVEKIKNSTIGKVQFFDDKNKQKWQSVGRYLSTRGFVVLENKAGGNGFEIYRRNPATFKGTKSADNIPVVYIDDIILHQDLGLLRDMRLDEIDYIEINHSGVGAGMRGGGGVIKIKTNPMSSYEQPTKKVEHKSFDVPLKFDVTKRFYIPKYTSYESNFFNEYGIIDWFSNVSTDIDGVLNLKLYNNQVTNLKLFIEGVSNDGTFISEVKELKINE
ncbi:hypothetical protein [Psychroserpens algicola]|uniref:TonB-dependent receptor plug domain-containing protein n=1 Tax=Psychroserpens algicola TaxID=1719034 RepID=A0ABT0HB44_9FLAO|nr:hypothetical protein [Psychroserpens algicola]MCK8481596.1 hypothetical protein [Psychroserpens algicola]